MTAPAKRPRTLPIALFSLLCTLIILLSPSPALSEGRQIVSGPYSLSLHGGSLNDSATVGVDARTDFLNPVLNLHIFGSYDIMDASSGLGVVDSERFGAGFALSHTYPGKANLFIGTAFINEMNEYFGHVYFGGKVKVSGTTLLSASYGLGLGPDRNINKKLSRYLTAQSVDWGKLGAVYVTPDGFKTNLYYYLTDPGGENISGLEGEASYPVTDSVTVGINGSVDLTRKTDIDRDWRGYAFLTYAFGSQTGSPVDVALDKNSPIAYPKVLRSTGSRAAAASSPLTLSQSGTTAIGCSTDIVTFTASGGTGPYTWSATGTGGSEAGNLSSTTGTTVNWQDNSDNFCSVSGTVQVTVTDSSNPPQSVSGVLNVIAPPA